MAWLPMPIQVRAAVLVVVLATGGVLLAGPRATTPEVGTTPSPCPATSPGPAGAPPLGLALVCLDGSGSLDLGLPRDAWMPELSPDGSRVVFITSDIHIAMCGACSYERRAVDVAVDLSSRGASMDEPGASHFLYPSSDELDIDAASVAEPAFAPDGKRLAFQAETRDRPGQVDLFVLNRETGETWRLTDDPAIDEFPAWSPDGETILYANLGAEPPDDSGFSWTQEIWSIPAAGGTPRQLTFNNLADTMPDVAADGTVAYWREPDIWTMDLEGSGQARLASVPADSGFNPRWSPDGSRVALLRYDPSERAAPAPELGRDGSYPLLDVVVVDLASGDVADLGTRVASDVNPVSWTPDGEALLVNRYDEAP